MNTVLKYSLKIDEDVQEIEMPEGARVLTVGLQDDKLTVWAEVNTENALVTRRFIVCRTGQPLVFSAVYKREYVGSVQIFGTIGTLVPHVFELK